MPLKFVFPLLNQNNELLLYTYYQQCRWQPGCFNIKCLIPQAVAVAQSVREFAPQAEGTVFESVKTSSDRSAIGVSVTGPRRWPLLTDVLCHSKCVKLKNLSCQMVVGAEHRSTFAVLHRNWWRLHVSVKFSSGTNNPKQANKKQT